MPLAPYRRVLAVRAARQAVVLGVLVRVPLFAGTVVLTLHVVSTLDRDYGQAGLAAAAATVCVAISGPWRGRLLDRHGLRRVVLPSVAVSAACWSLAPFTGYWVLFVLAALAGLFAVPTFSIIRQAMITAAPEADRRTALALDSVAVEISFMIGPAAGVWAATTWPTSWVLFTVEMFGVLAGVLLWIVDPAMTAGNARAPEVVSRRQWIGPRFVAVCAAAAAATIVLSGTDISIVASLRSFHDSKLIGPVLSIWGLGSLLGGLVYGALRRSIPAFLLLAALSAATLPMAFAPDAASVAGLAFVAGLVCAPTITATVDQLSRIVPQGSRGEALGWHGSALTTGSALGAPLAGAAIDRWSHGGGLVVVSLLGLAVATVGTVVSARRHRELVPPMEPRAPAASTVR
jgi:MFS family permease